MPPKDATKLTDKEKIFVLEYLVDGNATQAAIRAGYATKHANSQGYELMLRPKIRNAIDKHLALRLQKTDITGEKTLKRLDNLADFDIADAYDDDSCLLPIKKIPAHLRKAMTGIKVFEKWEFVVDPESGNQRKIKVGEVIEVKWSDKIKPNELLGKNQKLWSDEVSIVNNVTGLSDEDIDLRISKLAGKNE